MIKYTLRSFVSRTQLETSATFADAGKRSGNAAATELKIGEKNKKARKV